MQTKKIWNFLGSMQFALLLLLILVVACTAGSLIPQQEIENYYFSNYSEGFANFILAVGLNNVFRCWWFVLLVILLCINLLLCNLLRFPQLVRRTRQSFGPQPRLEQWDGTPVIRLENPEILFREMGFRKVQSLQWNGTACRYACKNKIGLWGAWLCHLGMLVVIVGFALGQILQQEYTVYGIPGQTKPIGDTPYVLTIDDFEIRLREDDTVDQYESWLTLTNTATLQFTAVPSSYTGNTVFRVSVGSGGENVFADGQYSDGVFTAVVDVVCSDYMPVYFYLVEGQETKTYSFGSLEDPSLAYVMKIKDFTFAGYVSQSQKGKLYVSGQVRATLSIPMYTGDQDTLLKKVKQATLTLTYGDKVIYKDNFEAILDDGMEADTSFTEEDTKAAYASGQLGNADITYFHYLPEDIKADVPSGANLTLTLDMTDTAGQKYQAQERLSVE